MNIATDARTCFVVMGFGEKTDFQSTPQRVLNLDKTFEYIIKPAVEECGLECIRADTIIHATVIDKPMYEQLLQADVVIADLSTANANAIYELGVRHALRPHATIVLAERNFRFPFDLSHVSMLTYAHLGEDIGHGEVLRVRTALAAKIRAVLAKPEVDSPVFLFLPSLTRAEAAAPDRAQAAVTDTQSPDAGAGPAEGASFAALMQGFRAARAAAARPADWLAVIKFLNALQAMQPHDPFITQQLALATYKAEVPDRVQALRKARDILMPLAPPSSSDAETVGLWGAVHKRLWELGQDRSDLDQAIRAYARGYFFRNEPYNGINFAFLLDVRAALSDGDEAIADRVLARRMRSEVLALCQQRLESGALSEDDTFWLRAARAEALIGLRDNGADAEAAATAASAPQPWMAATMMQQIGRLKALLS